MPTSREWQLAGEAARRYQEILVPSILGPAARALVDAVPMEPGERVLDVGCGTGAASRLAASKVGPGGTVVGVDVNPGMLACAAASSDGAGVRIEWREASATELPFPEGSFDVVLCAQTLQFLGERAPAVSEMRRVVREGGRVAVSTWAAVDRSPYFRGLVEAMSRHVGEETAAEVRAPVHGRPGAHRD
ncbi:MAG TPA: SAM-dependent methyltransferase, partial [Alphaproteobacteria bacterium]|nr:SAM-dependent methyltransferase [Alphaproteobacteria bacterium]